MRSKVFGPILALLLVFGGFAGADAGWGFHPFRHGRSCGTCQSPVNVYPQPQPQQNFEWRQDGIFKARFEGVCPFDGDKCKEHHDNYCEHWVKGYITQDGYYDNSGNFHPWIYYTSLINDPLHPGIGNDIEQIWKDLENDIVNIFHKHKSRMLAPKAESKPE